MNRLQLQTTLYSAAASTFEELALLWPTPQVSREGRQAPLAGSVVVLFDGPLHGSLTLRVTAAVLASAATNMLALHEPPAAPLQRDAVGELANVICGSVLPRIAGRRAVFRLGPPQWYAPDERPDEATIAETRLGLDLGRAEVELRIAEARLAMETAGR